MQHRRFLFLALTCLPCVLLNTTLQAGDAGVTASDPFARRGFNFGHLRLHPTLSTDFTFTDNATRVEERTQSDVLNDSAAGIEVLFRPMEHINTVFSYEVGWHDYLLDKSRDYLSHKAVADVRVRNIFLEGFELSIYDSYLQSGNTGALENNLLAFSRYATNLAHIKAQYDFNRFSISGKYGYTLVDYFSRANSTSDYIAHAGDIEGAFKFIPTRLVLFGSYNITRVVRSTNIDNFDTHTVLAGVRGTYSKLQYSIGGGYSRAMLLSGDDTEEGPSLSARVGYTPHERLTLALEASRRFVASPQVGISSDLDIRVSASLRLTAHGKFTVDYTRNHSDRLVGADQVSFAYNGAFDYKLSRFASAIASFTRTEREVSSGTGGFVINEGRIGFRLAW
ncbi:MAG TPA: outer membrane beta-barrel protein [Planctomycetota bacterium]|nr:outer membrane beta-barrel protein [Planctomycetota bacterium]